MKNEEVIIVRLSLPVHEATYEEELKFRSFVEDLAPRLSVETKAAPAMGGGPGGTTTLDMLVLFVSGGALATSINVIYGFLRDYLQRNQNRELTFERGDTKITLKGRSPEEEIKLLHLLFPEAIEGADIVSEKDSVPMEDVIRD